MTDEHVIKIIEKIGEVSERVGRIEAIAQTTLEQCQKTNGRTTKNEEDIDELKLVNAEAKGQWKSAGAIGGAIATMGYFVLNKLWK